jgi:hypothetical protein
MAEVTGQPVPQIQVLTPDRRGSSKGNSFKKTLKN